MRKHRTFILKGNSIEVVSEYDYLGITMSYNKKFPKAIDEQLVLARKASFVMISRINNVSLLTFVNDAMKPFLIIIFNAAYTKMHI